MDLNDFYFVNLANLKYENDKFIKWKILIEFKIRTLKYLISFRKILFRVFDE